MTAVRVLGLDPSSTKNQGWAVLDISPKSRLFVACGVWRAALELFIDSEDFCGVELVAIESAPSVYNRKGFGVYMASGIAGAQRSAGLFLGLCDGKGVPAVEVAAGDVRRHVVGRKNATDAEVKRCVKMLVAGWPTMSSTHSRDAALAAIFGQRKYALDQTKIANERRQP